MKRFITLTDPNDLPVDINPNLISHIITEGNNIVLFIGTRYQPVKESREQVLRIIGDHYIE